MAGHPLLAAAQTRSLITASLAGRQGCFCLTHEHTRALTPGPCCWPVACGGGLVVVPPPASNRKSFSAFGLMQAWHWHLLAIWFC
jgi:hypothetical protein